MALLHGLQSGHVAGMRRRAPNSALASVKRTVSRVRDHLSPPFAGVIRLIDPQNPPIAPSKLLPWLTDIAADPSTKTDADLAICS
jgi:hypothetical protein